MSVLLKTIEAFPRGRTTLELFTLLDATFDHDRRDLVHRELAELQANGRIFLDRDDRWRAVRQIRSHMPQRPPSRKVGSAPESSDLLVASVASFSVAQLDSEPEKTEEGSGKAPDPQALLRYYRSALQTDPRGALIQTPDRHGVAFQMLAGKGTLFPAESQATIISVRTEDLPDAMREALARLDGEENGVALGWPLSITRRHGAPALLPVGLAAAN